MRKEIIIGIVLIFLGIGIFVYYDYVSRPEGQAHELLVEGKLMFERGDNESINNSISVFTRIIAKYPHTKSALDSYYFIAQGYEKLGLNRLAYLKYIYILKTSKDLPFDLQRDIKTRIARLMIMKSWSEEGVNQLLGMLNYSTNRDMRSRIYTELGHSYLKNRNYKKARRMFDIALTENGTNEEAIIGKARSFKRMGYDNHAYDLYEYFLKYYGNFSHFSKDIRGAYLRQVYNSGYYNYRRGRYYQSISYFKRMLRYFPGARKGEHALYYIGECYYGLKQYESALSYYNRVLSNSYHPKDQDARIKKGYSYFMSKRYDLAAREFQRYIKDYPTGRHITSARKWKKMSSKEILYRIKNKNLPESENGLPDDEDETNGEGDEDDLFGSDDGNNGNGSNGDDDSSDSSDSGVVHSKVSSEAGGTNKASYENVAEL
ncbi:MAG: tetratricopeptide repeat protein [bacterium]|nr:tetratricopeptide repeat protein [bacterium]